MLFIDVDEQCDHEKPNPSSQSTDNNKYINYNTGLVIHISHYSDKSSFMSTSKAVVLVVILLVCCGSCYWYLRKGTTCANKTCKYYL